ncbi:MAG: hypothetical protein UMU04_02755 [Halanaerobiales bacterium]|nr:hypothetical protein [Halanaerobiales bacterium]
MEELATVVKGKKNKAEVKIIRILPAVSVIKAVVWPVTVMIRMRLF